MLEVISSSDTGGAYRIEKKGGRGAAESPEQPLLPRNYLRPCILLLLRERRAHGYDLLTRLPDVGLTRPQQDGRYADSGAVYRTLHRLEGEGLVRSAKAGSSATARRRIYDLTPAGREELHRKAHVLKETSECLEAFVSRYQRPGAVGSSAPPSRWLPSLLAQTTLRRPLRGLNPLRRKSDPDDVSNRRQLDHA